MKEIVTIAHSAVNARLHEPSRDVKLEVQRALSYRVDGAEFADSFKSGRWDGRSSFLDFKTGTFPAGFVHYVSAHLRRAGYTVNIVAKPLPEPLGPENPKIDAFPDDPRYDYQPEVVRRLVKHGQIIAQVATGGGKSRIARLAFVRINRPTLFLTTRSILMYQMKKTFENDLGVPCSVLGDGQFGNVDEDGRRSIKKMSVGMVQTLVSRLQQTSVEAEFEALYNAQLKKDDDIVKNMRKRLEIAKVQPSVIKRRIAEQVDAQQKQMKLNANAMKAAAERAVAVKTATRNQTINLLSKFEFVILEEAHEVSGTGFFELMRHCRNAHYRLALTATPFMKDCEEANMRLMASSGPIAIKVSEKTLIDRGILATPYFKIVDLKQRPPKLLRGTGWQAAYRLGIVDNDERTAITVAEVGRAARYGLTSMVLIQQKAHGLALEAAMLAKGLRVRFIQGENDQDERDAALAALAKHEIDVLIGTTILDVGVDVPSVGLIVLAGGGKAEVALRQRIGRGLRAKKVGPNVSLIVDFNDHWNNHTSNHARQRLAIIKETEGFGENIVAGDFNFETLGFERKAA